MALNAKKAGGGGKRQPALDSGAYPARLVQLIDLGVQKQRPYNGQEKDPAPMMLTTYELTDEFVVDDDGNEDTTKPRWVSEDYPLFNLASERAKSTKRYYALDPQEEFDGDWTQLLGTSCMVTLTQNESKGRIYNNIADVSTMRPKEAKKNPELVNEPKVFLFDEPDMEVFFSLPGWLQDRIKESLDYEGSNLEKLVEAGPPSDDEKGSKNPEKKKDQAPQDEDDDIDDWDD